MPTPAFLPTELYSVATIRNAELLAMAELDSDENTLMEQAGMAAFNILMGEYPAIESITVFVGRGNNGGDGLVLARLAHMAGVIVEVYSLCAVEVLPASAKTAARQCAANGIDITPYTPGVPIQGDVIIDALLGIGLKGGLRGDALAIANTINAFETPVLSIDIPSGVDADTGYVATTAIIAEVTVTFIGLKKGMLTADAPDYCGEIFCDSLNLDEIIADLPIDCYRTTLSDCHHALLPRPRTANKGEFGHVLIIGGDYGMPGAAILAGVSAYRAGAGLVSIATRPEHVSAVVSHQPELMCHGIHDLAGFVPLVEKADVIVIGPGLGQSDWSQALLRKTLEFDKPLVVDASALHLIAGHKKQRDNWILTPHPGEAAVLLNCDTDAIQSDRFSACEQIVKQYGGACVLKGAGTIVLTSLNAMPEVCGEGNPGMASGGMGDVLSGIIGALLAQGFDCAQAAMCGVSIHALAGDKAASIHGERGLMATDCIAMITKIVNPKETITIEGDQNLLELLQEQPYDKIDTEDSDHSSDDPTG